MKVPTIATVRACPVCNASRAEVLHRQDFVTPDVCDLPVSYDVVSCERCGMVYADTAASQTDYDTFYRDLSKYDTPGLSTGGGDTPLDRDRLAETAEFLATHFSDCGAPVLDVGCGNGGLLAALAEIGFTDLAGLDPSPNCARNVQALGFRATAGSVYSSAEEIAEFVGQSRYVVLSHVLEHLRDLRAGFENVISWVEPGGLIWVEVPDASRYAEHYVVPFYYFDIEHINHFDADSLSNLAAVSGLDVVATMRKTIAISSDVLYPAVGVVMQVPTSGRAPREIRPARAARAGVAQFVQLSREDSRWEQLVLLERSGAPVAVWGAGSFAQRLLASSPLGRCNVVAFVDNDRSKQGTCLAGRTVRPPDWLEEFDGTLVVAAAATTDAILSDIEALDLANPVVVVSGSR